MTQGRMAADSLTSVRLDKWLWAARFYKTRTLATQAVDGGQVKLDGERVKPSRPLKIGACLELTLADGLRIVFVKGLAEKRGSATVAQHLYQETPESQSARELRREQQRLQLEPSATLAGRPTKQNRRQMDKWRA